MVLCFVSQAKEGKVSQKCLMAIRKKAKLVTFHAVMKENRHNPDLIAVEPGKLKERSYAELSRVKVVPLIGLRDSVFGINTYKGDLFNPWKVKNPLTPLKNLLHLISLFIP